MVDFGAVGVGETEILDFERSAATLFRGGEIEVDASVSLFASFEFGEFFGEDFFALVPHVD